MRTELLISWRYLTTKRKEKFISLISVISVFGVAIGVMALIVVIGVMTGFDKDLRDKIVGNYSHITITSSNMLDDKGYDKLLNKIAWNPHIVGMSPYVQGQVLLKERNRFFGVAIKGIDPYTETQVSKINDYLISGSLALLDKNEVFIGKELASQLGLGLNSKLIVYSPGGRQFNLKVAGIFVTGMYDYDLNLMFVHLNAAQEILGLGSSFSSVAVKLDNLYLAQKLKQELSMLLGFDYNLKTWIEANQNFFAALSLEKEAMFIILTLIILVASFNIISTLIVLAVEKTKDIGILKTIGMNSRQIRSIFTYEGIFIGGFGVILGTLCGVSLCMLLKKYQFINLPQDIYYIDKLPVSIEPWPDIIVTVLAAMFISLVSTIYPAAKAAKLKPVEALRYE